MKSIVDRFISEKDEKGIIAQLYDLGLTQREIEEFIIEKHEPYLKNKSIPRVQVYAYMSQYIDSLIHMLSDKETKSSFESCLEVYWKAKEKDPVSCYKSYQYWQEDVLEATSKLVSMINIDPDRSQMNLHEKNGTRKSYVRIQNLKRRRHKGDFQKLVSKRPLIANS